MNTTTIDESLVAEIKANWRSRGFPHYNLPIEERIKDFNTFSKYDRSRIIEDGVVKQTLHALGATWHYFPHHWDVRVGNMRTAWDVWNDDEMFGKAIRSRIKWGGHITSIDGTADFSQASMRKALRTYSGVQRVSNFRPSAAAGIYDNFCDGEDGGTVWDMSCGYGGRLLGAIVSPKVSQYIGTEPSSLTFEGLKGIRDDFAHLTNTKVRLTQSCSEIFTPMKKRVDLCFSSPPYFNTEIYSDEPSQSCNKYKTVDEWNYCFLRMTIRNCHYSLRNNGLLILNVADVKSHKTLVQDTLQIASEEGFEHKQTLQMALSSISKGGFKYEPVLVFRKSK